MKKKTKTESTPTFCYFVPVDAYVEGQGYRVSVVKEDEAGHHPTGTWPYTGAVGETRPYFWGHDYERACGIADRQNAAMGVSPKRAAQIVASSMKAQNRKRARAS